ncbi:MAG: histone deacetylase [Deltaproteobacteria bacterium]|nr:histone deacetylase [Deltaproteobacteria bacterium]
MPRLHRSLLARLHRLTARPVEIWTSPVFRLPLSGAESALHIEPRRVCHVSTWLLDMAVTLPQDVHLARPARWESLALVHTDGWLRQIDSPEAQGQVLGVDPRQIPVDAMVETWRTAVGAVVDAAGWVREHGGRAAVLLGGFHHAFPDRGGGFCALNDVAVAVRELRRAGLTGRVLVIDLDAHPPDGIEACLEDDSDLHIASLSAESAWEPLVRADDLRVPRGTQDEGYLAALDRLLARTPRGAIAFYLAGADPLAGDPHGGLAISPEGLAERDRRVLHHLGATPTVLLPAGGYTPGAWRIFATTIAIASGISATPSRQYDPLLRRTLDITRTLDPNALRGEEDWLSSEDLASALGMGPEIPRLLGFYTRPGMEYALHRLGMLAELERMGFSQLRLELQTSHYPHVVRLLTPLGGREEAVVEIALSRRSFSRWNTLFVDWLSLRDPRAPFSPDRPRMPGQDTPGLGMMREVVHVLLRMCERLGLDGLSFVPSWYHIAWFSRHRWTMLDPDDRGLFMALQRHFKDVPLGTATRLLAGPGIETEHGEVIRWKPSPMVLGLNPEFQEWLHKDDLRARRVADALASCMVGP